MSPATDHLMIAPVALPLAAGAAMLLLSGERRRNLKAAINVASTFALVAIAIALRPLEAGLLVCGPLLR